MSPEQRLSQPVHPLPLFFPRGIAIGVGVHHVLDVLLVVLCPAEG